MHNLDKQSIEAEYASKNGEEIQKEVLWLYHKAQGKQPEKPESYYEFAEVFIRIGVLLELAGIEKL